MCYGFLSLFQGSEVSFLGQKHLKTVVVKAKSMKIDKGKVDSTRNKGEYCLVFVGVY